MRFDTSGRSSSSKAKPPRKKTRPALTATLFESTKNMFTTETGVYTATNAEVEAKTKNP